MKGRMAGKRNFSKMTSRIQAHTIHIRLEAQHLVKGPQELKVAGLWFSCGGGQGPLWDWAPWEGRGGQGIRKASEPSAWPRVPLWGPWAEAPKEAVFPEAGPSLRGMGPGGTGGRSFRNHALLYPPLGPSRGHGSQLYLTHCEVAFLQSKGVVGYNKKKN